MELERRNEGASEGDLDDNRDRPAPEPMRLEAPEDPLRGMSDGEVLQRLELL
jgi:hypothetical protein